MASIYTLKDYKITYFEYKVFDKSQGQRTVDNLLTLFHQLKKNTQCVSCTDLKSISSTIFNPAYGISMHLQDKVPC